MTILVSIISEQTLPNYLIAKNFDEADYHLFLTTSQTIRQFHWLKYSIEKHLLKNVLNCIEITSDDYLKNIEILEENEYYPFLKNAEKIIINITGGTKIMVLAVIDYFKKKFSDKIFLVYHPINSDKFIYIHPYIKEVYLSQYITNINEYLNVSGYLLREEINKISPLFKNAYRFYEFNKKLMSEKEVLKLKNSFLKLKNNSNVLKENKYNFNWIEYLKKFGYKENQAGEFFECFIYYKILNDFDLDTKSILSNLKITLNSNISNDYEFDVAFVYQNKLYLVETKINLKGLINIVNHYSGIKNLFGLNVFAYILTLKKFNSNEHKLYHERLKISGVSGVYDLSDMQDILENKISIKELMNIN